MSGAKTLTGPRPAIPAVPATVRFGRVGDVHEREADLIAETAEPLVAKTYAPPSSNDGVVPRSSSPAPSFGRAVSSAGSSLTPGTRRHFQERLGHDFGEVRIHADQDAAAAADTISARAFTRGRHIFFAAGEYRPSTPAGRHLLAHELAHTRQGRGGAEAPDAIARQAVDTPSTATEVDAAANAIIEILQTDPEGGVSRARAQLADLDPITRAAALVRARALAGPDLQARLAEAAKVPARTPETSETVTGQVLQPPATLRPERPAIATSTPATTLSMPSTVTSPGTTSASGQDDTRATAEMTVVAGEVTLEAEAAAAEQKAAEHAQAEQAEDAKQTEGETSTTVAEIAADAAGAGGVPDLRARVAPLSATIEEEPGEAPQLLSSKELSIAADETEASFGGEPVTGEITTGAGSGVATPSMSLATREPPQTSATPSSETKTPAPADIGPLIARLEAASDRADATVAGQVRSANARVNTRASRLKESVAGKVEARVATIRGGFGETRRHLKDSVKAAHTQIGTALTARQAEADLLGEASKASFKKQFNDHRTNVATIIDDAVAEAEKVKTDGQDRVRTQTATDIALAQALAVEQLDTYPDTERGQVQKNAAWRVYSETATAMEEKIPEAVAACGDVVEELPDGFRYLGALVLNGFDDGLPELLASTVAVAGETSAGLGPQAARAQATLKQEATTIRIRLNGLETEAVKQAEEIEPRASGQIDAALKASQRQVRLAGKAATNRIHEVVAQAVSVLGEAEAPDPTSAEEFTAEIETFADAAANGAGEPIAEIASGVGRLFGRPLTDADTDLGKVEKLASARRLGLATATDTGLSEFVTAVDEQLGSSVKELRKVFEEKGTEIDSQLGKVIADLKAAFDTTLEEARDTVKKMLDDALRGNVKLRNRLKGWMWRAAEHAATIYDYPVLGPINTGLDVVGGFLLALLALAGVVVAGILAFKGLFAFLVYVGIPKAIASLIVLFGMLTMLGYGVWGAYLTRRRHGESFASAAFGTVGDVTGISEIIRGATRPHLSPFERAYEITHGVGTLVLTVLIFSRGRMKKIEGEIADLLPNWLVNPSQGRLWQVLGRAIGRKPGAASETTLGGGSALGARVRPGIEPPLAARPAEAPPLRVTEPAAPRPAEPIAPHGPAEPVTPRVAEAAPPPRMVEPLAARPVEPPARTAATEPAASRPAPEPPTVGPRPGEEHVIPLRPPGGRPPRPTRAAGKPEPVPDNVVPFRPPAPRPGAEPAGAPRSAAAAAPKPASGEVAKVVEFVESMEAGAHSVQQRAAAGGGSAPETIASARRPIGEGQPPVQPAPPLPSPGPGGGRLGAAPPTARLGRGPSAPEPTTKPPKPDLSSELEAVKRAPPQSRRELFDKLAEKGRALLDRLNASVADFEKQVAKLESQRAGMDLRGQAELFPRLRSRKAQLEAKRAERDAVVRELNKIERQTRINEWNRNNPWPCFAAGTPVWTEDGPTPIELLQEGDRVWAYDFAADRVTLCPVAAALMGMTNHFYHLDVAGETVQATGAHPFWDAESQRWIAARELAAGTRLHGLHAGDVPCAESNELVEFDGIRPTFNLSIDGAPSYFVGPGVLVHNETPPGGSRPFSFGAYTVYEGYYEGSDPKFRDFVYEGRTKQDIKRREEAHRRHARIMLKRTDLTSAQREYYEFKRDMRLRPRMTGLNKTQSIYFEQLRLNLARERLGAHKVMFLREEAQLPRFRDLFEVIRKDPQVQAQGLCPK